MTESVAIQGRDVFQEAAEVAEARCCVQPFGHRRRLQAGRLATTRAGVVQLDRGQRRREPAPAGALEGADVVDATVAVEVESHRRGHRHTIEPGKEDV